jgi:putative flippase GtrA
MPTAPVSFRCGTDRTIQFLLYLIVGGLSFAVDIGAFVALRTATAPVIPASIASFCAATCANYFLCSLLAFTTGRFRRQVEVLRFIVVVLVGLTLNTALVWYFVYELNIHPTAAKIGVVPIVLIWNYLARRWLVFHAEIPAPIRSWLERNLTEIAQFRRFLRYDDAGSAGVSETEARTEAVTHRQSTGAASHLSIERAAVCASPVANQIAILPDKATGR